MSSPSPEKTDRDRRFERYLSAAGIPRGEPLYKSSVMLDWLERNSFPRDEELSKFLSCPVYRMLKLLDSISTLPDPLGMQGSSQRDEAIGENWIRYCAAGNVQVIAAEWGGVEVTPLLFALYQKIKKSIKHISDETIRVEHPKEKYETFSGGFEMIPTFGLFPFYLHRERLRNWHVIPFGSLTHLGLCMSDELASALLNASSGGKEITVTIKEATSLIEEVSQDNDYRFLYLGGGHAAYRIILNSLGPSDYSRLRMSLHDIHTVKPDKPSVETIESILRGADSGRTKYILITDLGDSLYAEIRKRSLSQNPTERNSLTCLRLQLNEPVPVGIGFSLCTMAKFLNTPALLREIARILRSDLETGSDLVSALARNGVTINSKYIRYIDLLGMTVATPVSNQVEIARIKEENDLKERICTLIEDIARVPSRSSEDADQITRKASDWVQDINASKDIPNLKLKLNNILKIDRNLPPMQAWQELEKAMHV